MHRDTVEQSIGTLAGMLLINKPVAVISLEVGHMPPS